MDYLFITIIHWSISIFWVLVPVRVTTFFLQAFKIVEDSWKFSMLLQYILWDVWPILMILDSTEQLQKQLE